MASAWLCPLAKGKMQQGIPSWHRAAVLATQTAARRPAAPPPERVRGTWNFLPHFGSPEWAPAFEKGCPGNCVHSEVRGPLVWLPSSPSLLCFPCRSQVWNSFCLFPPRSARLVALSTAPGRALKRTVRCPCSLPRASERRRAILLVSVNPILVWSPELRLGRCRPFFLVASPAPKACLPKARPAQLQDFFLHPIPSVYPIHSLCSRPQFSLFVKWNNLYKVVCKSTMSQSLCIRAGLWIPSPAVFWKTLNSSPLGPAPSRLSWPHLP